ncbi:MAG: hypothetical protein WAP55_03545 [Minisyncoccia bacterium]
MPEKFRRVKREPRLANFPPKKRWGLIGLVLIIAAGITGWFYLRSDVSNQDNQDQTKKIDRTLAAIICRAGECFWLNKEGISFSKSARSAGNLVPSLEDKTGRELKVGSELLEADILAELSFLKQRVSEDLGLNLKSGETSDANLKDFDFTTSAGWTLKVSIGQNAYKTLETLKQTLAEINKTNSTALLDYIDLRIPNKVYYKLK